MLSGVFFAYKVSRYLNITSSLSSDGECRTYTVHGQLFFVSASSFGESFDFKEVITKVVIDVSNSHFWDLTAVNALDNIVLKFRRDGTDVEIVGLNDASKTLILEVGKHDKPGALEDMGGH